MTRDLGRDPTQDTALDVGSGPPRHDRFAHLRAGLQTYRAVTASTVVVPWCVGCELHHAAQVGGLCPVCEPMCEPLVEPMSSGEPEHVAA